MPFQATHMATRLAACQMRARRPGRGCQVDHLLTNPRQLAHDCPRKVQALHCSCGGIQACHDDLPTMVPPMKKSRLVFTLAVLGTGAVMAGSYLTPRSAQAPPASGAVTIPARPAVTVAAPAPDAPGPSAAPPAATTVVAPHAPLFRSATSAAPIGTTESGLEPARIHHTAPLLEAATVLPAKSGHAPVTPDATTAAMTPLPAAVNGPAAAEPGMSGMESATRPAAPVKSSRRPKLSSKVARTKPASKRTDALFLHPLGTR